MLPRRLRCRIRPDQKRATLLFAGLSNQGEERWAHAYRQPPRPPRRVIRTEPTPAHRGVPLLRQGIKLEWKAPKGLCPKAPRTKPDQSSPDDTGAELGQGQHSPLDPDQGFLDPSPRSFKAVRPAAGSNPSRVKTLLDMAHSRKGIGAWEITELAHLRGIDPSAPLRTIFARGM
jgi:hypothetical protein